MAFLVVSDKGRRNYSSQGKVSASSLTQLIQAEVCIDIAVRPGSLSLYCLFFSVPSSNQKDTSSGI